MSFMGVTLPLGQGWTGVVGANGAGKTTWLRQMAKRAEGLVLLCEQEVEMRDRSIHALADRWDKHAIKLRDRFRLCDELERWPTLSPGERKRWQIAAALAAEPDVLLLDEPSNHLDADGRAQLLAALSRFRGSGVIVSHDRTLLDALTTATVRIRRGSVELCPGNYSAASAEWTRMHLEATRDAAHQKAAHKRALRGLAEKRDDRARAQHSIAARPKSSKDSDGRSVNRKARAAKAEASHARRVRALKSKVDRLVPTTKLERAHGGELSFAFEPSPRAFVLSARDRHVARDARIHLIGPNGCGKTTFIRELVAASTLPSEKLLYLPQELDRAARAALIEQVRQLDKALRGRVMQLVSLLGVDPGPLLRSPAPSPGEARKLAIALGLGRKAWCLLLDEPENHLDLPSIERLERALSAYPGALMIVTHDVNLARRCTSERWSV